MSICVIAAGKTVTLAFSAFTLAWTHSVELSRWEEDWRLTPDGLKIVEARVKGAGAGMEPPADAVLKNGWWAYVPDLPPQKEIVLAASGATGDGWSMCAGGRCGTFGKESGGPIVIRECKPQD